MKRTLILGINGQDGSYLAEILLQKGYEVHGLIRRSATGNLTNLEPILSRVMLHYGDLADPISLARIINEVRPEEIYNEADQDHAGISFKIPAYNFDITGSAVGRLLEIVRQVDSSIKIFQPVTSNMFGNTTICPQNEETPFSPMNPYSCAKVFALNLCQMYRKAYGMFISVGIFFNHESPRRTESYVTRKITNTVSKIKAGLASELVLGDTSAQIDWGYAREYMEAAWNIMQLEQPDDFVIGTGEVHSVEEFVNEAFHYIGMDSKRFVKSDSALLRPAQNSLLKADSTKAKKTFGFEPKVRFKELVKIMMDHDLEKLGVKNNR
ncbi:MAG: GDP-mannose 4,6-dehydratase [Deltaproteobacteria bacterium]|nr:GDP-mannose 4,6-dehydratase [Deltaproteobacteria bacterium]